MMVLGLTCLALAGILAIHLRDRIGEVESTVAASQAICCRPLVDTGPLEPSARRPGLEAPGTFVVKPTDICCPVPEGWESWCSGTPGTECSVRYLKDGGSFFTVTVA